MTTLTPHGQVEFRFYRPCAERVAVVGTFNRWQDEALPMQPDGNGWWTAVTALPQGEHRFRYLADGGRWYTDFASNGVEHGRWGWNRHARRPRQHDGRRSANRRLNSPTFKFRLVV
jgi:1,4-alpha-glucan branching enzyme